MGIFDERLQGIIHLFKYRYRRSLAGPLARSLVSVMRRDRRFDAMEAILPVPLHTAKARSRGYNQSELIAVHLARTMDLELIREGLLRIRNTPSQSGLDLAQREINVRGAFAVKGPRAVAGRRLILTDDVLTTGATVDACAEALLHAGAEEVCVLTVARTPQPGPMT
jgi:ComF family protein